MKKTQFINIILFVLNIFLVVSCKRAEKISYPQTLKELKAGEITLSKEFLLPTKILIVRDKLIVFDEKNDYYFYVFDKNDYKFLYSFGKKGKGPSEFIDINPNTVQEYKNMVVFIDINNLYFYNVEKDRFKLIKEYTITLIDGQPINYPCIINDSIFICLNMGPDKKFELVKYNYINNKFNFFSLYPKKIDKSRNLGLYTKYIVKNDINNSIAGFYTNVDLVRFYKYDKNKYKIYKEIYGKEFNSNIRKIYRVNPFVYGEFIYVQNVNYQKKDFLKYFQNNNSIIEKWNWYGEIVEIIKINRPILVYCIDKDRSKIIALTLIEEKNNKIYEFNLK